MRKKIYEASYYERHRDDVLKKAAAYYADNKETLCERQRRYYHMRVHPDTEYIPHEGRINGVIQKTKYKPKKKSYDNMTEEERQRKRRVDATMSRLYALAAVMNN